MELNKYLSLNMKILTKLFLYSNQEKQKLYEALVKMIYGEELVDWEGENRACLTHEILEILIDGSVQYTTMKNDVIQVIINEHLISVDQDISFLSDYVGFGSVNHISLFSILESKYITNNQILQISDLLKRIPTEEFNKIKEHRKQYIENIFARADAHNNKGKI